MTGMVMSRITRSISCRCFSNRPMAAGPSGAVRTRYPRLFSIWAPTSTTSSSSSTSRIVPWPPAAGSGDGAATVSVSGPAGKSMRNRVPRPGVETTSIWPPQFFTMPYAEASPSPVPRPRSLVVKKGIENPLSGVFVHAHAGVGDKEPDAFGHGFAGFGNRRFVPLHNAGRYGQPAPVRHGVGGVRPEVEQELLHLAPVHVDGRYLLAQVLAQFNASVGSLEGLGHFSDEPVQIKGGRPESFPFGRNREAAG